MFFLAVNDLTAQQLFCLLIHIVEIDQIQAAGRANGNAGGFKALFDAVLAERALVREPFGINESGIIRAGGQAGLASGTDRPVDLYRTVFGIMRCPCRTVGYAGGVVAMLAALRAVLHGQFRVLPSGLLHNPVAAVSFGYMVLLFAGIDTCRTADTYPSVDDHPIIFFVTHALCLLDECHEIVLEPDSTHCGIDIGSRYELIV